MSKGLPILLAVAGVSLTIFIFRDRAPIPETSPDPTEPSAPTDVVESTPKPVSRAIALRPQSIRLRDGTSFALQVPAGMSLTPAAEGLGRARFMARSPDGRLFVPDMIDLSDNRRGKLYVADGFDPQTRRFASVTRYLSNLRNPNSVAFHTDTQGRDWLYLALTDQLVRYPYTAGSKQPDAPPQILAKFPDYGLSYKHGGWHLTRTIAFGGDDKLYVSVGSSCNACEEKEPVRACVVQMNPDGSGQRIFSRGLRNAVGLRWIDGRLIATNMGADHLGKNQPLETLYALEDGRHYGWPYCYETGEHATADPKFNPRESKLAAAEIPRPLATFAAHSAPLGVEAFDGGILVALHGSSDRKLGRGYKICRVSTDGQVADFVSGFLQNENALGRPCDVMRWDERTVLFTDDHRGVLYSLMLEK